MRMTVDTKLSMTNGVNDMYCNSRVNIHPLSTVTVACMKVRLVSPFSLP